MKDQNLQLGEYEHYKGIRCRVVGIAKHSETLEELVVYQKIENGEMWVRPLSMFVENVEVNGKTVPRFRYLGK